jgi:anti-sigma factor RsiW
VSQDPAERDLTCQVFVTLITEYMEGTLPPRIVEQVEAHLALCPHCVEYLDEIRRTVAALGRVPVRSLSEGAREGILEAFRTYPRD